MIAMLKGACVGTVLALLVIGGTWLGSFLLAASITQKERPEKLDTNGLLRRIEDKIDRLEMRVSDHDEAMQKACGPR